MIAGGGTRTLTLLPGRDFESRASADSATPATLSHAITYDDLASPYRMGISDPDGLKILPRPPGNATGANASSRPSAGRFVVLAPSAGPCRFRRLPTPASLIVGVRLTP